MDGHFVHAWHNTTTLHPLGAIAVVLLGLAMLQLPRRYVVVPALIMACFISPAQRIVILTADFHLLRVLVLFGWARLIIRREMSGFVWKPLDSAVVAWAVSGTVAMTLLHGTIGAAVNRLGFMFDAVGMYFMFRCLVRSWSDVITIGRVAAIIAVPVAVAFIFEKMSGRNVFSVFGGVPETTMVRKGTLRCQGPFPHPIVAGCFWVALMPLIGATWWMRGWTRYLAPVGMVSAVIVVIACSSSTPASAVIFGIIAALMFPLRYWLGWMRWGFVMMLIMTQVLMSDPIWHLLARVDLVGGSTGWHRYLLVNEFVNRIDEWWLFGTPSTEHWWDWGMSDITNQYILEGVNGGLFTLILFLVMIVGAFRALGRTLFSVKGRTCQLIAWAMGISLFLHVLMFFGISYFGQITMIWFLSLSMIGSLDPIAVATARRKTSRSSTPRAPDPRVGVNPA